MFKRTILLIYKANTMLWISNNMSCARSCPVFIKVRYGFHFCALATTEDVVSKAIPVLSNLFRFISFIIFPTPYNIHTLQTTHQEEDRDEKKSQHTKRKKDEKKTHPTGEIKSQPSDEKKPHPADEQKSDGKISHPEAEEETRTHRTQHTETPEKGEKAEPLSSKEEKKLRDERLEADSDSHFSESAESSRKSSLSESSSRELNEVDLIDGKDRIASHFPKQIFFSFYSHKSYAPFLSVDL